MSVYYRTLIQNGRLLDIYPNAAAAFSLRLLRSGYTGPLFAVRRSVDNALLDVYPNTLGTFDETTLLDWVGYNLWTYSEQMQQGVWAKINVTSTTDTIVAPNGNTTGDVILETATNNIHSIQRGLAVTVGREYTVSFWVKAEGRDFFRVQTSTNLSTNNSILPEAVFNLSNGTKISDNGFFRIAPTITSAPNGWYKIEYGVIAGSTATSTALNLGLSTNGSVFSYAGNTSLGVGVWGIQISETSTVKPYQKTEVTAGGEGRIQILYSQTGDGRTATEGTANEQLRFIERNRVLKGSSNKPIAILPGVAGTRYTLSSGLSTASPHLIAMIYSRTGNMSIFGNSSVGGSPNIIRLSGAAGSRLITYQFTAAGTDILNIANEDLGEAITIASRNGNVMRVMKNGVEIGSKSTTLTGANVNSSALFQWNSANNTTNGNFYEAIWWNQDYIALRDNITQEINNYYGIY